MSELDEFMRDGIYREVTDLYDQVINTHAWSRSAFIAHIGKRLIEIGNALLRLRIEIQAANRPPEDFHDGVAIRRIDIGDYVIIAYHPWIVEGVVIRRGRVDRSQIEYTTWVNGEKSHYVFDDLDLALLHCIAMQRTADENMHWYLARMLGMWDQK